MKIASFTMMRNESAILDPFMDQLETFFDHSIIINHGSIDASKSMVEARCNSKFELFDLTASGHPQSHLATMMMKRIFTTTMADWFFCLNCDEFLPFETRADLESALSKHAEQGYCHLRWSNIVPENLDNGNIFDGKMKFSRLLSPYSKFIVSRSLFERHADLQILQGYHKCISSTALPQSQELSPDGLYHLPVTSRLRFVARMKYSGKQILNDQAAIAKYLGVLWENNYIDVSIGSTDGCNFQNIGLSYPHSDAVDKNCVSTLNFKFPYIRSSYQENLSDIISLLCRKSQFSASSRAYMLQSSDGEIFSSRMADDFSNGENDTNGGAENRRTPLILDKTKSGQSFSDLVEPLFSLPTKLPPTAWAGHIPFLMVLIKIMQPRTYVELGTHYGASLIGAATASKLFDIPMELYGIDSWEGDEHAGAYDGETIYNHLKEYTDLHFSNVKLIRSYFDIAKARFMPNSIDILHIDGLHTYDAVKHDFLSWLPKMSPDGVILFHDICVYERGFGVHQLWHELSDVFVTISFGHSHGLGVLFLDASSPRVDKLSFFAKDRNALKNYTSLVTQIGNLIESRMDYINLKECGRNSENELRSQVTALYKHIDDLNASIKYFQENGRLNEQNIVVSIREKLSEISLLNDKIRFLEERLDVCLAEYQSCNKIRREMIAELNFYRQQNRSKP